MTGAMRIDSERIALFESRGWLLIRELVTGKSLDSLSTWADELKTHPDRPGGAMKYYEDHQENRRQRLLSRRPSWHCW